MPTVFGLGLDGWYKLWSCDADGSNVKVHAKERARVAKYSDAERAGILKSMKTNSNPRLKVEQDGSD